MDSTCRILNSVGAFSAVCGRLYFIFFVFELIRNPETDPERSSALVNIGIISARTFVCSLIQVLAFSCILVGMDFVRFPSPVSRIPNNMKVISVVSITA